MVTRKALTVNNGAAVKRTKMFNSSRALSAPKKYSKETSVFVHARAGRQIQEGFGGGNRVGK